MDQPSAQPTPPESDPAAPPARAAAEPRSPWRDAWQLPALGLGGVLVVGAIVAAVMAAPKPNTSKLLAHARDLMDRDRYQPALDYLNTKVRPYVGREGFSPEQTRDFYLFRGRAIAMAQLEARLDHEENHRNIAADLLEAEKLGAELTTRDHRLLADAYARLGRFEDAEGRVARVAEEDPALARELRRGIVESRLNAGGANPERTLELVGEYAADPELDDADRVWAVARQGELLLEVGEPRAAITRILRAMPRFDEASPSAQGELCVLLGEAYMRVGEVEDARRQFDRAQQLLSPSHPLHSRAMLRLADADVTDSDLESARARYEQVIEFHEHDAPPLEAMLGLAEVNSDLGDDEAALETYAAIAERLRRGDEAEGAHEPAGGDGSSSEHESPGVESHADTGHGSPSDAGHSEESGHDGGGADHAAGHALGPSGVTPERVADSLISRFNSRFAADEVEMAMRYAITGEDLYAPAVAAPNVLVSLAMGHRRLAEDAVSHLRESPEDRLDLSRLDPATRETARRHFVEAAIHFRLHATSIVESDNAAYASSLYMAADSYDQAGDTEAAIEQFGEYASGFPEDPRLPMVKFRLARALQTRGLHEEASAIYRELIDAGHGEGNIAVGPFGDRSYVPLAQTVLMDGDPSNDAEAEALLGAVVGGELGGIETPQFREALIEMGDFLYRASRYPEAIERLREATTRFPRDPRLQELVFKLADAHRLEAGSIATTLEGALPEQTSQDLRAARMQHLREALALFAQVRTALESRHDLSRLERVLLRNATFYLGDCAYDMEDYDAAIRHYDEARERYPSDPATLVALIQIVNAYVRQGDYARARTAHQRAKGFYKSLPKDVWDDPDLPLGQKDWERWLDASFELARVESAPEAPPASGTDEQR